MKRYTLNFFVFTSFILNFLVFVSPIDAACFINDGIQACRQNGDCCTATTTGACNKTNPTDPTGHCVVKSSNPAPKPTNTPSPNSNPQSGSCYFKKDGSGQITFDSCASSGGVCTNTSICGPDGNASGGNLICTNGTCKPKSQITPSPTPQSGSQCRTSVANPGTSCGPSLQCVANGKNCTGSGLNEVCDGECKPRVAEGGGCKSITSGSQGNCQDGFQCINNLCKKVIVVATIPPPPSPPCAKVGSNGQCQSIDTGLGILSTEPGQFIQSIFVVLLSISGGIALLLIMKAGYLMMTAAGKAEQIQQGREQLVAAIVGLLFLIFSFVILEVIGVDILRIPGFRGGGINKAAPIGAGQSCNVTGNTICTAGYYCKSVTGGAAGQCVAKPSCDTAATNPCPGGMKCVSVNGGRSGQCQ